MSYQSYVHPHDHWGTQLTVLQADSTDLESHFPHEFSFKIGHEKHTFRAANDAERDGWVASLEKATADGKNSKDDIVKSDKYQDTHKHLGRSMFGNANNVSY